MTLYTLLNFHTYIDDYVYDGYKTMSLIHFLYILIGIYTDFEPDIMNDDYTNIISNSYIPYLKTMNKFFDIQNDETMTSVEREKAKENIQDELEPIFNRNMKPEFASSRKIMYEIRDYYVNLIKSMFTYEQFVDYYTYDVRRNDEINFLLMKGDMCFDIFTDFMSEHHKLWVKQTFSKGELIQQVEDLSMEGYTASEIASKLGVSVGHVYNIRSKYGIKRPDYAKATERQTKKQKIKELYGLGYSVEEIAYILDTNIKYVYNNYKE